jgi:hypothetical protein
LALTYHRNKKLETPARWEMVAGIKWRIYAIMNAANDRRCD